MQEPKRYFEFFTVTLLFGVGCGFASFQTFAYQNRYDSSLVDMTHVAMLVGGIVGLGFGLILDATVKDSQSRKTLIKWLWAMLVLCVYLFLACHPASNVVHS